MAITGDILRATYYFKWNTIEARMVEFFQFTQEGEVVPTEALIAQVLHGKFNNEVWQQYGATAAQYYRTVVDNLSGSLLFGDYEESFNGALGDTIMPAFNAISVKQIVSSRETRAGYKRLPFLTEATNIAGVVTLGEDETQFIEDFFQGGLVLQDPITDDVIGYLAPAIIGRVNVGTPEAPVYELDLDVVNLVIQAKIQPRITSQTSRKS